MRAFGIKSVTGRRTFAKTARASIIGPLLEKKIQKNICRTPLKKGGLQTCRFPFEIRF